jgi:hypothetical protein
MTHRRTRRTFGALLALGLMAAGTVGLAPKAEAAGLQILPSHTTISPSANPAPAGLAVTLTSQVTVPNKSINLGPLSPTGTITFSKVVYDDEGAATVTALATAPVSGCTILLSKCTATSAPIVLSNHLDEGQTAFNLRATYSGDTLTKPSQAEVGWSLAQPVSCKRNVGCETEVYAGDGTAKGKVSIGGVGGDDATDTPLTAYFDTIPLSCTTPGTGDGFVVDISGGEAKQITLTTFGPAATKASTNPDRICYSSPIPFTGATFNEGTGQYVGLLPLCGVDSPDACVVPGSVYTPAQTCPDCSNVASLVSTIFAPPGDPKSTR